MPPGMRNVDEKPYASCEIIQKPKNWSEEAVRRINDKYDNYNCNYATSGSTTGSDSASGSSIDTSDVSEEERLKIDICFRGLKTQVSNLDTYRYHFVKINIT